MIEIDKRVCRPELTVQFLASNKFSRPFQQCHKYLKWLLLQLHFLPTLTELSSREIDLENTETDDPRWGGGRHGKFAVAEFNTVNRGTNLSDFN